MDTIVSTADWKVRVQWGPPGELLCHGSREVFPLVHCCRLCMYDSDKQQKMKRLHNVPGMK